MSSPPNGASPTSFDTQLPGSAAFLNASSTANRGPVISQLPLTSVISSDSVEDFPTSSKDVSDLTLHTTQNPPTQRPSTTRLGFSTDSTEETVGGSSTTVAQARSSTASDEPTLPTTTFDSNQADSSSPAQTPSSAEASSPQIITLTTVPTSKTPTATPSNQKPLSATIPPQSSTTGTGTAKDISSAPAKSTSAIPSRATAVASQPTDDSTQEPQVFSAESVDPPAEPSALFPNPVASSAETPLSAAATSSTAATLSSAPTGAKAKSSTGVQPPVGPTGAVNQRVSAFVASSLSTSSTSVTSLSPIPTSTSIPTSAPGSAAIFAAPSTTTSTPLSITSAPVSDSLLSDTLLDTATDAASTTTHFAGGIAAFPTAISSFTGDVSGTSHSAASQPTGQPIEDPVGPGSKPSTATIVGGTVGGIAAVAVILVLLWLWKRRAASGRMGSSKQGGFTGKGSPKSMAQRFGISPTLNAVRHNLGEKLGSRNVNMDRGNSQFLEAAIAEPSNVTLPPDPLCQHPVTPGRGSREFRKGQGISLEPGKLNPFSDANSLMAGMAPRRSSSSLLNPFSDDNMVLPPPVSASTRRSRGRSLGGLGNFQVPRGPPRPHSVHRESLHDLESMDQNRESFLERRDKFRSDPFDLELQANHNQLFPPGTAVSTRGSSVYSGQFQQNSRDSYTSRYVSGSSMGDWGVLKEERVTSEGPVERVDSPTLA